MSQGSGVTLMEYTEGQVRRNQASCVLAGLLILVLTVTGQSFAQITFERTYGGSSWDQGNSVEQTLDGGYIITGYTGAGSTDVYLVKTDSLGDVMWTKTYGGSGDDRGYSVQQTADGGCIVAGYTRSFGAGLPDVYLLKTDSFGDTIWTSTYGGIDLDEGYSVQQTSDGGYIIAGRTCSFGPGVTKVYLVKTDSVGAASWSRTYGADRFDEGYSVQQTSDGGYIIVGSSWGPYSDSHDVYLVKTDTVGNGVWTKVYGGSKSDMGRSVQQTLDGGYIVAGWSYASDVDSYDVYLLKTDSLGDTTWSRTYGGSRCQFGSSVQQTSDGGYIIAGVGVPSDGSAFDLYLVKTDSVGDTVWTRTYGEEGPCIDSAACVRQTQDGGYVVVGYTTAFGAGLADVYLIKTEGSGVGVEENRPKINVQGSRIVLLQNNPNPFRYSTAICYYLPTFSDVTLEIYDIAGRLVETLVNERQGTGVHEVRWDRESNPGGIYFCRLNAGEFVSTRSMVVVE